MTPDDMLTRVQTRPFVPFRVVTTDGTNYEVRHPELVMVTLGAAYIGYPVPGKQRVAQRVDMVSLMHIIRVEDAEPVAAARGNGETAREDEGQG
jgi:hypothetical protein